MFKKFTQKENKVLTEIYRRLNFFHKGDLNTDLLYPAFPSEAKIIREYGLIAPSNLNGKERPRVLNWYSLTEKGKVFFSHYIIEGGMGQAENSKRFGGEVKKFDHSILEFVKV